MLDFAGSERYFAARMCGFRGFLCDFSEFLGGFAGLVG